MVHNFFTLLFHDYLLLLLICLNCIAVHTCAKEKPVPYLHGSLFRFAFLCASIAFMLSVVFYMVLDLKLYESELYECLIVSLK